VSIRDFIQGISPPALPNCRHRRGGCFLLSSGTRLAAAEAVQLLDFAGGITRVVENFESCSLSGFERASEGIEV